MLGGGLGSQPSHAVLLSEFIPVNLFQLRKGFREYLIVLVKEQKVKSTYEILNKGYWRRGILRLVDEEKKALSYKTFEIDTTAFEVEIPEPLLVAPK
jgi:sulfite reductase (ferredoxin)